MVPDPPQGQQTGADCVGTPVTSRLGVASHRYTNSLESAKHKTAPPRSHHKRTISGTHTILTEYSEFYSNFLKSTQPVAQRTLFGTPEAGDSEEQVIRSFIQRKLAKRENSLKKGMKAILQEQQMKAEQADLKKKACKSELLKLLRQEPLTERRLDTESSVAANATKPVHAGLQELFQQGFASIAEEDYFNLDSDYESATEDNRHTIRQVLCEVCLPDECYAPERTMMLADLEASAASVFVVALKETEDGDGVAIYFRERGRYCKLTGDPDLPLSVDACMVKARYVFDASVNSLTEASAELSPDIVLLH